jgi:CubicO group peptidase (beta-lactamase class C family)
MKSFIYVSLILSLIFTGCQSVSEPELAVNVLETRSGFSEKETDLIYDVLSYYPNNVQLSIAVIDSTGEHYYGALRSSDTLRTIDNLDRLFEIGSISKVFTSSLLAYEVVENGLNPDDSVLEVLNFDLKDSVDVTYKQLSNHTSGLPRVPGGFIWNVIFHSDNPYQNFTDEKLREYLSEDLEMDADPGTEHSYSNLGAGFLGYVLEQKTEKSYEELLNERIFSPLGMTRTTLDRSRFEDLLVAGVHHRGGDAANWDLASLVAAGGIYSTAEDMVKFAKAQLDSTDEIYSYQQQPTYTISDTREMALGWFIIQRDNGDQIYWHNGGTGGYRSSMTVNPDNGTAVIVLSNISAGHSRSNYIDHLSFDLLRIADGLSVPDRDKGEE